MFPPPPAPGPAETAPQRTSSFRSTGAGRSRRIRLPLLALACLAATEVRGDTLELVVATGGASPDGNGVFQNGALGASGYDVELLQQDGAVIFTAGLVGTSNPPDDTLGLFRFSDAQQEVLCRSGDGFASHGLDFVVQSTPPTLDRAFLDVFAIDGTHGITQTAVASEDNTVGSANGGLVFGENKFLAGVAGETIGSGGSAVELSDFPGAYAAAADGRYHHLGRFVDPDSPPQGELDVFSGHFSAPTRGDVVRLGLEEELGDLIGNTPLSTIGFAANADGDLAVMSTRGLLLRKDGGTRLYGAAGDVTPDGLGTFVRIAEPGLAVLNEAGESLFYAVFDGLAGRLNALFKVDRQGELSEVVRLGEALEPGGPFVTVVSEWEMNDHGEVFVLVRRGSGSGILRVDPDGTRVELVGTGDLIPGDTRTFASLEQIRANNAGQVTFIAASSGTGFSTGLHRYQPIAQRVFTILDDQGSSVDGNPVVELLPTGSIEGYALNHAGQCAIAVLLEDGRQAVVRSTPEPLAEVLDLQVVDEVMFGGSEVMLDVATTPGFEYQLFRNRSLRFGGFRAVGEAVPGNGAALRFTDPGALSQGDRGFYLVRRRVIEP